MNEDKLHRFTAHIADVEPFVFNIKLSEEPVFRRAVYHVNEFWTKMSREQPGKDSHYILAKVALAFAELYYRKADQMVEQQRLMEDFEQKLDSLLIKLDQ